LPPVVVIILTDWKCQILGQLIDAVSCIAADPTTLRVGPY